ncbi:FAD-dependent monooxygenase [Enterovirga aerilata]|uniref:Ubiquinone biosynthesis protein UbiH n=1 Tax=Enterovirga aerilata TaxID=2730920 RepID=A0A849I350_9HYPH|nr:FAD-dependent monooxygenase [Enterovirga sp. DB1703]NNM72064.1 ubiquinone biosynthesis protein UbiH [Enterovirga sp. DB1703]
MTDRRFDVVLVGAGAVGLAGALAFSRAGFATCLVGPAPERRDGRTAALLETSLAFLRGLGVGSVLEATSQPLRTLRLVDDTESLFRPPPVEFRAAEIGLDAFGRNIENAALVELLVDAVRRDARILWLPEFAAGLSGEDFSAVRLRDGSSVAGALVVAADGRKSRLRDEAGLEASETRHPQVALTTILGHEREHGDVSTEFHTGSGPFTLVPLPGRRSSLVWVNRPPVAERLVALPDAELASAIEARSHRILGRMRIDGPRGIVPLSTVRVPRLHRGRLALAGEAAHAVPPIGAQGLNLGFADVEALLDLAMVARSGGADIGSPALFSRYQRARLRDVQVRTAAIHGLNRALLSGLLPLDMARGFGLGLLARVGPLRRAVMRAGLGTARFSGTGSAARSRSASGG